MWTCGDIFFNNINIIIKLKDIKKKIDMEYATNRKTIAKV